MFPMPLRQILGASSERESPQRPRRGAEGANPFPFPFPLPMALDHERFEVYQAAQELFDLIDEIVEQLRPENGNGNGNGNGITTSKAEQKTYRQVFHDGAASSSQLSARYGAGGTPAFPGAS